MATNANRAKTQNTNRKPSGKRKKSNKTKIIICAIEREFIIRFLIRPISSI